MLTSKSIYNDQDNSVLANIMDGIAKQQQELQGGVVDPSVKPKVQVQYSDEFISNLNKIGEGKADKIRRTISLFKLGKGPTFNIDDTFLEPSKVTMIGGGFVNKYKAQLSEFIYSDKEQLDGLILYRLVQFQALYTRNEATVSIVSGKYKRLLPKIVVALNELFDDNQIVLNGIATLYRGVGSNTSGDVNDVAAS